MIRIAAVDDEWHVLDRFERMVAEIKEIEEIELCGLFGTGELLLDFLKEHPLDAIFLDIEMPNENGLQLSERILNLYPNIDIIFSTAYNEYAVEAFELEALDYIMKPLTQARLMKTINRLKTKRHSHKSCGSNIMIQCIGDFELFVENKVISWKSSKAKEILAFLVYKKGIPVGWEKIAAAIWPEYNHKKAQTNFHATTYLLRKKLAQEGIAHILENGRGKYRIKVEQFQCDVYQLESNVENRNISRREDIAQFEKLSRYGYMEACGYDWAYPKSAELGEVCSIVLKNYKSNV